MITFIKKKQADAVQAGGYIDKLKTPPAQERTESNHTTQQYNPRHKTEETNNRDHDHC